MGYPRFLRRRGYGVHSPFAYRFITEVIGEKYAFYHYLRIPERGWLFYRLAVMLQPVEVKSSDKTYCKIAELATSKNHPYSPVPWSEVKCTKIMVNPDPLSIPNALLNDWIVYVKCSKQEFSLLKKSMLPGMAFFIHRERIIIIFPWAHLPQIKFSI